MSELYKVLDQDTLAAIRRHEEEFALHVLEGLSSKPKGLSSRYFYDDEGSRLFQKIMEQPEYYLTDCETEVFNSDREKILAPLLGRPINLVDLGAGDGTKTLILLEHLQSIGAPVRYVPIDISEGAMRAAVGNVKERLPGLEVAGIVASYEDGLQYLRSEHGDRQSLVLFLGSNIGNFGRAPAESFLRRMWTRLNANDHVLLGFDLKKDIEVLLHAYNDSAGVTAAFNLNLLQRINNELGADFDLSKWRHYGTYDVFAGAMVSYLVATDRQTVTVPALARSFEFQAWEPVHTEYSYKYLESDIASLAETTGFSIQRRFYDRRHWFTNSLWRVEAAP